MSDNLHTAIEALRQAQPERDFLLISTAISRKRYLELAQLITEGRRHAKCGVFLCTFGGDSDAGFRRHSMRLSSIFAMHFLKTCSAYGGTGDCLPNWQATLQRK